MKAAAHTATGWSRSSIGHLTSDTRATSYLEYEATTGIADEH